MTRHKSRQFNFSLHAKINQIEDNFLIKPMIMYRVSEDY